MLRSLLNVVVFAGVTAGCATSQKSSQSQSQTQQGQRDTKKTVNTRTSKKPAVQHMASQMNAPQTSADDVVVWVVRMSSQETVFTVKDRQYVNSLPVAPKNGSLGEAALVVGLLRDILTPPGGANTFGVVDQKPSNVATTDERGVLPKSTRRVDPSLNLERRSREKGIDVIAALAGNSLLKNAAVYSWAWNASLLEGNSEPFRQKLNQVIKAEALLWQEIAQKSGVPALSPPPAAAGNTNAVSETDLLNGMNPGKTDVAAGALGVGAAAAGAAAVTPSLPQNVNSATEPAAATEMSPLTMEEANAAMGKAQDAASNDNYKLAVEEASKVPESAPQYSVAQENIRLWSNRAVTDLRKKAAYDYRSSTSINDARAKKESLKKAQGYLEEALKSYPKATNLDTVQDNLRMINSELTSLGN